MPQELDLAAQSLRVILEHQHPSGAYVASPNFPTYHYCWLRDGSFIAQAARLAGAAESAARFHAWVAETVQRHRHLIEAMASWREREPSGGAPPAYLPCRFTLDGQGAEDGWPNFQIDGYGAWLWALDAHVEATGDQDLWRQCEPAVRDVVRYLTASWDLPCYDCWEEHGDRVHPATLACVFGGLSAAGRRLGDAEALRTAQSVRAALLADGVRGGRLVKSIGTEGIDASLLWCATPFRALDPSDPIMRRTVALIEQELVGPSPAGLRSGGVYRYPEDTYYGGGQWILLAAWLGWHYVDRGEPHRAVPLLEWVKAQATAQGWLPEQRSVDVHDPAYVAVWLERWGPVATPLLWSHAMHLVLCQALAEAGAAEDRR